MASYFLFYKWGKPAEGEPSARSLTSNCPSDSSLQDPVSRRLLSSVLECIGRPAVRAACAYTCWHACVRRSKGYVAWHPPQSRPVAHCEAAVVRAA